MEAVTVNNEYRRFQQMGLSMLEKPHFLAEQIKSNQVVTSQLTPFIEEGMRDGSIRSGNPKVLADLVMLLINFWLFPGIFPCNLKEFKEKVSAIKQIFDNLGFPFIDKKLMEKTISLADLLGVTK